MTGKDFAGHAALECAARAGRILPVLQSHLELEGDKQLSEVQQIALGSVLLMVFDGLTDTLERMAEMAALLSRVDPIRCVGGDTSFLDAEIERLLRESDDER